MDGKAADLPGESVEKSGKGGCSLSAAHVEGCDERVC